VPTPQLEELQLDFNSDLLRDHVQVINSILKTKIRLLDQVQHRNTIICYFPTNMQLVQDNTTLEVEVIILRSKVSHRLKMLINRSILLQAEIKALGGAPASRTWCRSPFRHLEKLRALPGLEPVIFNQA